MVKDNRTSNETRANSVVFESDDAGTSSTLISIRPEATFSIDNITLSYNGGGSEEADVEFYDDEQGTPEEDLDEPTASYVISPGDFEDLPSRSFDEFEDDVMVVVRDNDDDVHITGDGHLTSG